MTGNYQYTIGRQRIADLHTEAERQRLAATVAPPPTRTPRANLFARLGARFTARRVPAS
jgi:hypothetical protein